MIVILLGILDIFAGLSIFSLKLAWGPMLVTIFVIYLLGKSLLSLKSFASIIDIFTAILFIIAIFNGVTALTYVGTIWLIQKGIISFF